MRIVHIIPNLRKGGAERLVIDIVRAVSKSNTASIKLILFKNIIEYDIEDIKHLIQIIPSTVKLSLTKKNEYQIDQLQFFFNDYQPQIIHTHLFEAEIISRSCLYANAKWFSHCHDNMVQFRNLDQQTFLKKQYFTNYFEKQYLLKRYKKNGGTTFITISKFTQNYFEKNAQPFKTILLLNAIDHALFFNKSPNHGNKLKLINIGALNANKNQKFIIEVCHLLSEKNIDFEMLFLGEGSERSRLEEQIKTYRLSDKIVLKGVVSNVEDYLKEATIYLHSSKSEGLGLTLIEAMAAGLPVITLDGKGNRDLIEQGKNGYMLFEEDAEKYTDTTIQLWNDKNKYQEISIYAQQFSKQFDIRNYCAKLLELYANSHNSSI